MGTKKTHGCRRRFSGPSAVAGPKKPVAALKIVVAASKKRVAALKIVVAAVCSAIVPWTAAVAAPGGGGDPAAACRLAVERTAERLGIPPALLKGIALTESGRSWRGHWLAWPWSINVDGRSLHFDTAGEAAAAVRHLGLSGARNIDVGCMQVSLRYWSHAFDSVEQAIDPDENAMVAGRLLMWLRDTHGSWDAAVASYHAGSPGRPTGRRYLCRVYGQMMLVQTGQVRTHPRCETMNREVSR